MTKIGRNDPCPCGSGKKYINCCLKKDQVITGRTRANLLFNTGATRNPFNGLFKEKKHDAQDLVYDGWEMMDADIDEASKCFQQAIKLEPNLADAYNGLAAIAWERKNLKLSEKYYRLAYEKAKIELGTEEPNAFHWWGELDTRPYMRARCGLGRVFTETKRYDEAIYEFKELLKRNPNDNQGIRYLVAPTYLLKGDIKSAIDEFDWFSKNYPDDPADCYYLLNWGLALFLNKEYKKSAVKFRATIFSNPYLIPIVLGEKPRVLPIWHSNNLMEKDFAVEYIIWYGELWLQQKEAIKFLQFIWHDLEIQSDYKQWLEHQKVLKKLEAFDRRKQVLNLIYKIEGKEPTAEFFKRLTMEV